MDSSFILVDDDRHAAPQISENLTEKIAHSSTLHPSLNSRYKPGSASSYAHNWTSQSTGGKIIIDGRNFVDAYGRVCSLRGVNMSGCCKTPTDHDHENFPGDHATVTFVGRPFPVEEAPQHFARLRRWGLSFIRFLVTWEAVEHAGPGFYDTNYLAYLRDLLSLLPQYGLTAFVSMHQDVWSRYSGGSGAPAWTLELAGFDLGAIEDTGSAWLHGQRGGGHVEAEQGLWPCGYHKLAASTMATAFWGGDIFLPKLLVKNKEDKEVHLQQFLQNAFLDMWEMVVRAVGDLEGVIGFQMMNEIHPGYINLPSLHSFDYKTNLHLSHIPSAFESFQLGAGHPTMVSTWGRSFPVPTKRTHSTLINTAGVKAWRPDGPTGGRCVWEYHDVWRWSNASNKAVSLRENYFRMHPDSGKEIDFYADCYYPFSLRWSERVRKASNPDKLVFLEAIPNEFCPKSWTAENRPTNMVFAPHWYDLNALFTKKFKDFSVNVQSLSRGMFAPRAFYWGQQGVRDNYSLQIRNIVEHGYKALGENPVVLGECGIPMDMNNREAFETEDFSWQTRMMDAMMTGLERSLVGFNLWNYNPDNTDERGDDWNGENFSWFSRGRALPVSLLYFDQNAPSLDNGGRILNAVVRPYPAKTAGIPISFEYEMNVGAFTYTWDNRTPQGVVPKVKTISNPPRVLETSLTSRETEIFVPSQLTHSRKLIVQGLEEGDEWTYDEKRQTLFIVTKNHHEPGIRHQVMVSVYPPPKPAFFVNDFWSDFGGQVMSVVFVFLAIFFYWVITVIQ
ncbi:cytoplasmic protein [Crepidotus variabilis]|uniref:Cytoplasmic protein n=1 Tax=Crepidotus variabilis TaxID=179855 RepID=A0A9P6ELL4_9AGAR|nr:cytoplasmic protein [Crepidotus variabilis]